MVEMKAITAVNGISRQVSGSDTSEALMWLREGGPELEPDAIRMRLRSGDLRRHLADPATPDDEVLQLAQALCGLAVIRPELPLEAALSLVPVIRRRLGAGLGTASTAAERLRRRWKAACANAQAAATPAQHKNYWTERRRRELLLTLLAEGLSEGVPAALIRFIDRLLRVDGRLPTTFPAAELEWHPHSGGWYGEFREEDYSALGRIVRNAAPLLDELAAFNARAAMCLCGLSSPTHLKRLHAKALSPLICACYEWGLINVVDYFLPKSLQHCGYIEPTETTFNAFVESYAETAFVAGRRLGELLQREPGIDAEQQGTITVAFLARRAELNDAPMLHVLPIMRHLQTRKDRRVRVRLYALESPDKSLRAAWAKVGIEVAGMGDDGSRPTDHLRRFLHLRRRLAQDGAEVAIWTGSLDEPFFLFGLDLAPVQILFSQYLHPRLDWQGIEHRVTYGTPGESVQMFNNRSWRVVPSCLAAPVASIPSVDVLRLRAEVGATNRILLGTLARTEKIAQPGYLGTVTEILKRHPECLFLWTGRVEHPEILGHFRRAGVLEQTRFVGWVDTRLYARVLDLLLDTFPLCNGITFLHAMEAGTACISVNDPLSYFGRDIAPMLERLGAPPSWLPPHAINALQEMADRFPAANSADEYIEMANALIVDLDYRGRIGCLLSTLYCAIYEREDLMGEAFARHLDEILDAPRSTPRGSPQ